ncbi:MBL fold metallo-hydrolase [Candidatus Micrarchaeota archaeon]|nr:MBL fold metallo-hydrolase [Candidatus Micrarchaeota archaeon]
MQAVTEGLTIAFDHANGDISFVSHAHSDHLNGLKNKKQKKLIASDETFELGNLYGERVSLKSVKTFPAGHILGARQILIEEDGLRTVYTGDICTHNTVITKGAEILSCDRLIIDATYGNPAYMFPPYEEVCSDIAKWFKMNLDLGNNVIIGAYELGKAQELIKILNTCAAIIPIVTEKIDHFSSIYQKYGVNLERIKVGTDEAEEVMNRPFAAIVPMRQAKRYFAARLSEAFGRKTLSSISTGWSINFRYDVDKAFPLSDHCDFPALKEYIEASGAKQLEFLQGDGKYLNPILNAI